MASLPDYTETDNDKPETDEDFLADVREKFEQAATREAHNREEALDDLRFVRLREQWPERIKKDREADNLPCLTLDKLSSFIRQVVNDARQNKPGITVHPVDSKADVETAKIIEGLIRNIEVTSDADVAYDTALEAAVGSGFGYFRINTAFTSDDTFDQDIVIERISNAFTVYADPYSEAADSSDWNCAFVATQMSKDAFGLKYKGKKAIDWDGLGYRGLPSPWIDGDQVMVCEYWHREEVEKQLIALSNGEIVAADVFEERAEEFALAGIEPVGEPRAVKSHKVTQYTLSGAEVLETVEWAGKYIPIVPVYGDEVNIEGERHFQSLIRGAKDAQREHNYWRSKAAEAVALAPRAPYIGPVGAFKTAIKKWARINDSSLPFVEYDGPIAPARQSYSGPDLASMQQAMAATDDMKAIIGLYDASIGNRSNETSGVAINARAREGDTGTFHFIDNLTRAIRHAGRIIIDLIPRVYSTERVIRILGEDMKPRQAQIAPGAQRQQAPMQPGQGQAQAIARIYDVTAGKYDLTVKAGPSIATGRMEAQANLVEIIRSGGEIAAKALGPMAVRQMDFPGSEEAADKLEAALTGDQPQPGAIPPQVQQQLQQMQQIIQQGGQRLQELEQENQQMKADTSIKAAELQIKQGDQQIKQFEAETDRIRAQNEARTPPPGLNLQAAA